MLEGSAPGQSQSQCGGGRENPCERGSRRGVRGHQRIHRRDIGVAWKIFGALVCVRQQHSRCVCVCVRVCVCACVCVCCWPFRQHVPSDTASTRTKGQGRELTGDIPATSSALAGPQRRAEAASLRLRSQSALLPRRSDSDSTWTARQHSPSVLQKDDAGGGCSLSFRPGLLACVSAQLGRWNCGRWGCCRSGRGQRSTSATLSLGSCLVSALSCGQQPAPKETTPMILDGLVR